MHHVSMYKGCMPGTIRRDWFKFLLKESYKIKVEFSKIQDKGWHFFTLLEASRAI